MIKTCLTQVVNHATKTLLDILQDYSSVLNPALVHFFPPNKAWSALKIQVNIVTALRVWKIYTPECCSYTDINPLWLGRQKSNSSQVKNSSWWSYYSDRKTSTIVVMYTTVVPLQYLQCRRCLRGKQLVYLQIHTYFPSKQKGNKTSL